MACTPGPFDKRRRRTRCAACRTLHLKCEGGHPCHSCSSSGRSCEFEAAARQTVCFRRSVYDVSKCTPHPSRMMTFENEICIWHFFSSYLPRNDFTARQSDDHQSLKSSIHKSAGLRNAVLAVGALDLSRCTKRSSTAVAYYRQAVSSLRMQLVSSADVDDATLWTSLLLAIFELMFDNTGTGFMLHFTKGLPALVRQRNFDRGKMNHCKTLVHTIQMLEAMRSAPFWSGKEPTLLEDPRWQRMTQHAAGGSSEIRGFTVLYDLMTHFLKWNNMVYAIALTVAAEDTTLEDQQQLETAAEEGRSLYCQLETWYIEHADRPETQTPLSLLSRIYYRALAISMTANFNLRHFAYCGLNVLSSSATTLDTQVDELCTLLRRALRITNLAGVLVLWPLRVAGSNCIRKEQAVQVVEMLREIRQRGFAVAQSFEDVLKKQWERRFLL